MRNSLRGHDDLLAELAERARRDFQLRVEAKDRFEAGRRPAPTPGKPAEVLLEEERYRKAIAWIKKHQAWERQQLEDGIDFFSTFSTQVLRDFMDDLHNDGPFATSHGLRSDAGDPRRAVEPHPRGLEEFIRGFRRRHADERYIRDVITFGPPRAEIIPLAWAALNLEAPVGLTEIADQRYTRAGIERMLLVAQALHGAEYEYAVTFVQSTGYAAGDEIAYRTQHLRYLTPDFAGYLLESSPRDEILAEMLTGPKTRFGLTLEGVTAQRFLYFLDRYTASAARRHAGAAARPHHGGLND